MSTPRDALADALARDAIAHPNGQILDPRVWNDTAGWWADAALTWVADWLAGTEAREAIQSATQAHGYAGTYRFGSAGLVQDCICGAEVYGQQHREHEARATAEALVDVLRQHDTIEAAR